MPWCAAHNQGNGAGPYLRYGIGRRYRTARITVTDRYEAAGTRGGPCVSRGSRVAERPGHGTGAGPAGQVALTRPGPAGRAPVARYRFR
jgi:hypothetical protein